MCVFGLSPAHSPGPDLISCCNYRVLGLLSGHCCPPVRGENSVEISLLPSSVYRSEGFPPVKSCAPLHSVISGRPAGHGWHMLQQPVSPSRRFTSRVATPDGVWVYWSSDGRDDTSRVRNLSLGGLFVETSQSRRVGSAVRLDFLVQEGQIRAHAVVQRVEPSRGLGLKFTAVTHEDRLPLAALMNRLRQIREAKSL